MKPVSAERRSRILTAGIGALLMIVMAGVLTAGFRLATQMKAGFAALQTASALQWQPPLIAQQLASLRVRLESRAYAGQTLADFGGASRVSAAVMIMLEAERASTESIAERIAVVEALSDPV